MTGAKLPAPPMLIALDIDGTVILEDESPSPGVVAAVGAAHDAGHEVMLATGRSWEGTQSILAMLQVLPEYVVCSNGAVIMKRLGGTIDTYERFHTESFDATPVLELLRAHLPEAHYLVELPDGRRLYTDYLDDWSLEHANRVPFEQLGTQPVSRVVVVSPTHTDRDFIELIERIGLNHVSYAVGWTAWLDIAPQGIDKSTALEMVREWRDVDGSQVMVVGDGRNDIGMFTWALAHGGRAVAMAQGPQEVRDAAGETTTSVTEGGVAAVLRAL
ncbi:Cof subfamily protein (haloacid dehalogenase superfamily) [Microbacterium endophyticum]|uniref:Cof subfamily protein (Haloacid dehalogenase superfamily) n=2 Tax=Microbacterium endophyticum TaxID=1526412 RepID=A0A7W4V2Y4_9MICO|nr:Cof subfamily protein (haloacid dehalogenase superfamily) [Microbacterium endophyticum]NIK36365.1 Cof subfamily protein (haloacid dehalogenase superfamily) [Microbacterium endophyticum]